MVSKDCKMIAPSGKPCVLIVDDEEEVRSRYERWLERWNYRPIKAEGTGDTLLTDAVAKSRKHRCPVALVDLMLKGRGDTSGLDLIDQLKPTLSIVLSGLSQKDPHMHIQSDALDRGAIRFVVKGAQDTLDRLREGLHEAICPKGKCREKVKVSWPHGISSKQVVQMFVPADPDAPDGEADDMVIKLFPKATALRLEEISGASRTPSLGTLQTLVLRVWEDQRLEPAAIKLGAVQRIRQEVQNFHKYIDGHLAENRYAKLKHSDELWDIGGAVYEFLGSSLTTMRPFSEYMAEASERDIRRSLKNFFSGTWGRHYREGRRVQARSLFCAYVDAWGVQWRELLLDWAKRIDSEGISNATNNSRTINPILWVVSKVGLHGGNDASNLPLMYEAVTHGDWRSDNILVDRNDELWVLDYERVGYGPILRDFTSLEADLLINQAGPMGDDVDAYHHFVQTITLTADFSKTQLGKLASDEANRLLRIVQGLRQTAHEMTGVIDARQYLWGLLLNAVLQVTISDKHQQIEARISRALTLGSVICERLDNWSSYIVRKEKCDKALSPSENKTDNLRTRPVKTVPESPSLVISADPHTGGILNALVNYVESVPSFQGYEAHSTLLGPVPGAGALNRVHHNSYLDTTGIVQQLHKLGQSTSGEWPLLVFIEQLLPSVGGLQIERHLLRIKQQLEMIYRGGA